MEENITATPTPEAAPTPKKKKKGLLIGGILATALVLAAGTFLTACGSKGTTYPSQKHYSQGGSSSSTTQATQESTSATTDNTATAAV